MSQKTANYNLLEENWIPILLKDGTSKRVSLVEAFIRANQIRQIGATNPLDRVSLLRFMLALLYGYVGNPPDNTHELSDSLLSNCVDELNRHRDCFNLLGNGKRFYQYKHDGDNRKHTANYLCHEIPTGTNKWHFRHSTDKLDGLCPSCCAMGLVRLPVFTTSGGQGNSPGINTKPPIYVIPVGPSLAETLFLSWRYMPDADFGTAAWINPAVDVSGKVPLLTGLTWLPRRVWLDDPSEPLAECISCGRRQRLIRQCVFEGLGSQKNKERIWNDPHTIYDKKGNVMSPRNALGSADANVNRWTEELNALINSREFRGRLWVVSFATVQNNKYLESMEYEISIPKISDEEKVQKNSEKLAMWGNQFRKIGSKTRKASSRKHVELVVAIAAVRPQVERIVSARANELIEGDDKVWDQAAEEYRPMMRAVAKSLSPGYTTAAVQRWGQIAGIKPNINPKKSNKKKEELDDSNRKVH